MAGAKQHEPGIYVTVEEGEAQILNTAEALGLPLKEALKRGLVEIIYLSRERVRAAQFPAILTSKIVETKARRLVLDSASHIVAGSDGNDELRQLLYKLAVRFKALDVTSVFTMESKAMFSTESITDRDFSPIADNLLMLRYLILEGAIKPSLTVVKTRGSKHHRDTHLFEIGKGGMRIGRSVGTPTTAPSKQGGAVDKNEPRKKSGNK